MEWVFFDYHTGFQNGLPVKIEKHSPNDQLAMRKLSQPIKLCVLGRLIWLYPNGLFVDAPIVKLVCLPLKFFRSASHLHGEHQEWPQTKRERPAMIC